MLSLALWALLATAPCEYTVVMGAGTIQLVVASPACELPVAKITGHTVEIVFEGQIVIIPLNSGWGIGRHYIQYTAGEGVAIVDNFVVNVKVRGW